MIGALRTLGLRVDGPADELTVSGTIAPPPTPESTAAWPARCCVSSRRWRRWAVGGGHVRRRRAGPGPAHRAAAGRAARSRRRRRRRRPAVPGARHRIGRRRDGGDRRLGVVAVRVRPAAVRRVVHRRPDRAAHRSGAAVGAAHRDDGGDAAAGRRRRRRLDPQPLAGAAGAVAARHWDVEPDLTNAVPFLAAAVVSGGTVRITGWPATSVQPADAILSILRQAEFRCQPD